MKIGSFIHEGRPTYGLVKDDAVRPVTDHFFAQYPSLHAVLIADVIADLPENCLPSALSLTQVKVLAPIPKPSKILCVGLNYEKPYPVAGASVQSDNIIIFGRHDDSLVGHGASLEMPTGEAALSYDFEGEIVAVVGKTCRNVDPVDSLNHVAGYACMNEGSVRSWQKHSIHAGKNFYASGAWGPWLTTTDEAGLPDKMKLITRVNGIVMQETIGSEMIHDLPKLISYLSHITPLNPGDVIATGSPDGTGGSRRPPAFLKPGDVVEVDISNVGTLRNQVSATQT